MLFKTAVRFSKSNVLLNNLAQHSVWKVVLLTNIYEIVRKIRKCMFIALNKKKKNCNTEPSKDIELLFQSQTKSVIHSIKTNPDFVKILYSKAILSLFFPSQSSQICPIILQLSNSEEEQDTF